MDLIKKSPIERKIKKQQYCVSDKGLVTSLLIIISVVIAVAVAVGTSIVIAIGMSTKFFAIMQLPKIITTKSQTVWPFRIAKTKCIQNVCNVLIDCILRTNCAIFRREVTMVT